MKSIGQASRQLACSSYTESVVLALRRIIRAVDLHSRFLVSHCGLTGPQLAVLKALSRQQGMATCELARSVHLSQATVTGILDRLNRMDLVFRQRSSQDRRKVLAWLSDKGEQILADAPSLLQESFLRSFSALADGEQMQILSSLQRVVAMMEAQDIDATPMLTTGPIDATPEQTQAFLAPRSDTAPGDDGSGSIAPSRRRTG